MRTTRNRKGRKMVQSRKRRYVEMVRKMRGTLVPGNGTMDNPVWGGFDTETQDGKAVLLGTDRTTERFPTSFRAIADFLLRDGRENFAAYNLAYDARACMWFLPMRALEIINRTGRVTHRGYKIHYIPRKLFEISKGTQRVRVWDVYTFYGGKLDATADAVLGEKKIEIPKTWYTTMTRQLNNKNEKRVREYCIRDARLARDLMIHLHEIMAKIGVHVSKPYSPASFAKEYFKDDYPKALAPWINQLFQKSYYGGRTEIYKRGRMGRTWHYDINSAYPAAYFGMASTDGAQLTRVRKISRNGGTLYGTYLCDVHVDPDTPIPLFPFRYHGLLIYPTGKFRTWIDRESILYARQKLGKSHCVSVIWGVELRHPQPRRIFMDAQRLYDLRKKQPALKLAYKLVLNSNYGVLCQQIDRWMPTSHVTDDNPFHDGEHWRHAPLATKRTNFALGGAITARCRIQLHKLMMRDPGSIVSCATDGVISVRQIRGEPFWSTMGAWGVPQMYTNGVVLMPGIAYYTRGKEYKEVRRGIKMQGTIKKMLHSTQARRAARLRYSMMTVDGLGKMLATQRPALFNVIRKMRKYLDVNGDTKRVWPRDWKNGRETTCKMQSSETRVIL